MRLVAAAPRTKRRFAQHQGEHSGDSLLTDDDARLLVAAVSAWRAYLDNPTGSPVVFVGLSNAGRGVAVSPNGTGKGTASHKSTKNNSKRKRTSRRATLAVTAGAASKANGAAGSTPARSQHVHHPTHCAAPNHSLPAYDPPTIRLLRNPVWTPRPCLRANPSCRHAN